VDLAEPKNNEILVRVVASGICHTDEAARTQQIPVPLPAVIGHEGCGIVEKTDADVKDIHPGDRVGFSYAYCGYCDNCRQGMPYACTELTGLILAVLCRIILKDFPGMENRYLPFSVSPRLQSMPL
jgi:aryl-alcohol dehydrogenase